MGQDLQGRTPGTPSPRPEPTWAAAFGNTVRLWLERHHIISHRPTRRRRLVIVLAALVAMAFGAGITLAFTGPDQAGPDQAGSVRARPSDAAQSMTPQQQVVFYRQQAAKWLKANLTAGVDVSCDYIMCSAAAQEGYPPSQLMVLPSSAPDPLGAELVIATQAIRDQFGTRLDSVYAPQVIAKFGSGPDEIDIRYLWPDGTAAYDAAIKADLNARIAGGDELLGTTNIQVSNPAVRARLRAGQVDPRLLITLGLLQHKMTVKLIAFGDSSPGEGFSVPLRGLEIGIAPGDLSALLSFLKQQTLYKPADISVGKLSSGQQVVTIQYGAPGPMNLPGGA